jgi:prepilin-type N-terminal cleavage/methylation domain-containing protein
MGRRGFSLVELLVVITIVGTLVALTTLNFSKMSKQKKDEAEVRQLHAVLVDTQLASLRTYRRHTVTISANGYVIRRFASPADTTGTVQVNTTTVRTLATSADSVPASSVPVTVTFSEKSYPSVDKGGGTVAIPFAICTDAGASAPVDSIIISEAKINLAKKNSGANCAVTNCSIR